MKLNVFRYFLVRDPNSLLASKEVTPAEEVIRIFSDGSLIMYYGKSYYSIISNDAITDSILVGFLLRSTQTDVIIPDRNEFDKHSIPNWEECFLAIDTVNQTILVQNIAESFTPDLVKNVLTRLLDAKAKQYDISAKVELICKKDTFWNTFRRASRRYRISFTLNAPNLFGGEKKADQYLKEVHRTTNMDKLTGTIENEEGNLTVQEKDLQDIVEYADNGGGHWSQTTLENGIRKITTSNSAAVRESLDISIGTPKELKEKFKYVITIVTEVFKRYTINSHGGNKDGQSD